MFSNHKNMMMLRKLDDFAVDFLPMRLIVSIAVIVAITGVVGWGYQTMGVVSSENKMEVQCDELVAELNTLYFGGVARDLDEKNADRGSLRVYSFNLPENLIYLSFGVDADEDNDGRVETGLTNDGSMIFYRVEGGSKKSIWLDENFRFREGKIYQNGWYMNSPSQGFILKDNGKTNIVFELVKKDDTKYVLICANDQIENLAIQ
ncbi:MAG: hypothetical protein V5A64_00410 [Candidatus Thermoplasmatota archaeon]